MQAVPNLTIVMGKYIPSRVALACPGLGANAELFNNPYGYARWCGYSYNVPMSASNPGWLPAIAWRPHQYLPPPSYLNNSGMVANDFADWAGQSVPHLQQRYDALVACYTVITSNPDADAPIGTPAMPRPHQNKGINVLFSDGSAGWLPRPAALT